jgi:hypothetical protein
MRNSACVTVIFLVVFLLGNAFAQNTLYVAPSGSDANAGTSLNAAFKTIQKAANTAVPGTVIYIKAGTYHERIIPYTTGTPGNEIVFKPYQNDQVIIDAAGTSGWNIFTFYGQAYMRLEKLNFQFNDNSVSAYQSAIGFGKNSHHISIKNCSFTNLLNPNATGIVFWGDDTTANGVHHVLIDSCTIGDANFSLLNGIVLNGNVHDISITHSHIHHCRSSAIVSSGADSVSKKPSFDFVRNLTIVGNKIDSNYNLTPGSYQSAIAISSCRNVTIERNWISQNDMAISITAVRLNSFSLNHLIRNNIICLNHQAGINIGAYSYPNSGWVKNVKVLNNTFFQNNTLSNSYELISFPADSITVGNNLIYAGTAVNFIYADWKGLTNLQNVFDYNFYASPFAIPSNMNFAWNNQFCTALGYFKSISGQELHGDFQLPNLVDETALTFNPHLFNNSPLINKGNAVWLPDAGSTDYDGQARLNGSALDIGADENFNDYDVPNVGISDDLINAKTSILVKRNGDWVFSHDFLAYAIFSSNGQLICQGSNAANGEVLKLKDAGVFVITGLDINQEICEQRIIKE